MSIMQVSRPQLEVDGVTYTAEVATIKRTMLGIEDHGIMTCYLHVEAPGWGIGFGGYSLDTFDKVAKQRIGTSWGCEFIKRCITTVGVEKWEYLPNKQIYVLWDDDRRNKLEGIVSFDLKRSFLPKDLVVVE